MNKNNAVKNTTQCTIALFILFTWVTLARAQQPMPTPDIVVHVLNIGDQIAEITKNMPPPEIRALWATRWDYTKPEHIKAIVKNAAEMNFNILLLQVRGNGTAFYKSDIEPWAWELTGTDPSTTGKDPGWDPLALAIEEAKKHGIELHAYINTFPAWHTQNFPPRDSGQLWWEHPDWFMADAAGNRMIPRDKNKTKYRDWYAFISPGVPEVQDYIASVCEELAANYDIDGIHFDYIRYPAEVKEVEDGYEERTKKMGNWSYDARSLARFQKETGVAAPDLDPEAWMLWRAEQITTTVRKAREKVNQHKPNLLFSAAVMADPNDARKTKYQDYIRWMREEILDIAITMNYTKSHEKFSERANILMEQRPEHGWVVTGLSNGYGDDIAVRQVEITRELNLDGFAVFAYSRLFDRKNGHVPFPQVELLKNGPLAEPARLPWAPIQIGNMTVTPPRK
jgi:uncharacterized lipoprotein YddW (UPF0748 family)